MNYFNLQGKTALITGASSGLGKQFAICLANAGARVILSARRSEPLKFLSGQIKQSIWITMDVSDSDSVQKTITELETQEEKIDICINAAGVAKLTPIFDATDYHDFERIIQTNVMGTWYVTHAIANHMKKYSLSGSIINIASVNGANRLREELSGYAASKAAVIQMTKALVGELSKANIRINCIAPGLFHTPLTDYKLHTEAAREEMSKKIPLRFVADVSDLDSTILYLASNDASRYVTGTCLTVDGGVSWGGS